MDQLLCRDDILGELLGLFSSDSDDVKREIAHIFSNMTANGHPERTYKFFRETGIVRAYLLNLTTQDYKVLRDMLENLYPIVKFGEGFKKQDGPNPFVM